MSRQESDATSETAPPTDQSQHDTSSEPLHISTNDTASEYVPISLSSPLSIPSLSSLTHDENTRQFSRYTLLSQKLASLQKIRAKMNADVSDAALEKLHESFNELAEETARIWQDYRAFQQEEKTTTEVEHTKRKVTRRRAAQEPTDDNEGIPVTRTIVASNSTQQKVTERLATLFHSEEEFEALEREIREYERRHGIESKRPITTKLRENREMLKNFNERRNEILDESFRKREERALKAMEARKKVSSQIVKYTKDLERSIDTKLERAAQRKFQLQYDIKMSELKMKWSYIVAFWVRMLILAGRLEDDRERRAAKEKQERLTKVVYDRMMPIVWQRRSERWQTCWTSFQHHWTWYQLWITTKKKKHATAMIKSFLQDTHSSLKLVTQVHHFKEKIKKCQEYVRKYHTVDESRMMSLLLQYTVVESKLINNEPLFSMEKKLRLGTDSASGTPRGGDDDTQPSSARDKKGGKSSARSRASIGSVASGSSSARTTGAAGRPNSKRKAGRPKTKQLKQKAFLHMEPKDMIANSLSLVRPSFKQRMALLREVYKQRREAYHKELSEYTTVLKLYEQKYRQFIHYQRAQAILKDESIDLPEDDEIVLSDNVFDPFNDKMEKKREELVDENGEVIPRPTEPFFSVYMSENDMEDIVMRGFQRVRDLEEEKYEELENKAKATPDEDPFTEYENNHLKNVVLVFRELRSYFGDHVYGQYADLFKKANIAANDCVKERREMKVILKRKQQNKKDKSKKPPPARAPAASGSAT